MPIYSCLNKNVFSYQEFTLLPLRESDILLIKTWRNEQLEILRQSKPLSDEDQIRYYQKSIIPTFNQKKPDQILFSFLKDNECIGYGGLVHINWRDKRGEISFLLKTELNSNATVFKRYFSIFLNFIFEIGFDILKFNKLTTESYDIRDYLIEVLENKGFVEEGRLKNHVFIQGRHVDSLMYRIDYDCYKAILMNNTGNILITSISKKTPLIKAVLTASKRINPSIKLFGGDCDNKCIGKYFTHAFWHMPILDKLTINDLITYCRNNSINSIIPTRDGELHFFAEHLIEMAQNNIQVLVSESDSISYCTDKLRFYRDSIKNGIPVILTVEDICEIGNVNCVVKERFGAGGRNVGINLRKEDAVKHAKNLACPIFQPFIDGEEISVDMYITKNGILKGMIMRKRELVVDGEAQITTTFYNMRLEELCIRFSQKHSFYGHLTLQVIQDKSNEFHIIECNPRFGGASTLSVACGLDSFYWFILESNGYDVTNCEFLYNKNIRYRQVRFPQDIVTKIE